MTNYAPTAPVKAKKPLWKRWYVWVAAFIVIGVIGSNASGGSETTTGTTAQIAEQPANAPAPEALPGIGQPASWDGFGSAGTLTVNSTRRITSPESPIGTPPENGSYLVVNVTVQATKGSVDVNPLYFRAQSEGGDTKSAEITALAEQLAPGPVAAGRQVRGDVAFDVAEGAILLDFTTPFSQPLATVSFTG